MDSKKLSAAACAFMAVPALLATPALAAADDASSPEPRIAQPGSHPDGKTYGEWAARWWQWALETPLVDPDDPESHPLTDPTGNHCDVGQLGYVWFLAGVFGSGAVSRTCDVPKDTALFFPLFNQFSGAALDDPEEERTEEFLREQVACAEQTPELLRLEIDGREVSNLDRFFVESGLFDVQLPENNVLGVTEDDLTGLVLSPSVTAGYYIFLFPLPPGNHTIHWEAASEACEVEQDVTYHLRVKKIELFDGISVEELLERLGLIDESARGG